MAAVLSSCALSGGRPAYLPTFPRPDQAPIKEPCELGGVRTTCVKMAEPDYWTLIHQLVAACYGLGGTVSDCEGQVVYPGE